jgi:hypothetical protein
LPPTLANCQEALERGRCIRQGILVQPIGWGHTAPIHPDDLFQITGGFDASLLLNGHGNFPHNLSRMYSANQVYQYFWLSLAL